MSEQSRGVALLLGAALCWSLGGLLIKLIDLDPMGLAGGRSAIAGVMIGLFILIVERRKRNSVVEPSQTEERESTRSSKGKWLILLGGIAYAGTVILFVTSTKSTTAANAILLQYTAPIWVALLSPWLLKEPITRIDWMAIVGTLIGMVLFFFQDVSTTARTGDLLSILSGLFFALCIIALRHGRGGMGMRMVFFGNLIAALLSLPFLSGASIQTNDLLLLLLLGTCQLGLGYILFTLGIARVTAVEGALIPVIEPILNPLWVALAIGEHPSIYSIAGGLLVLLSVSGRAYYYARNKKNSKKERSDVEPI